ncbi:MAG: GNAT family N-acetyltransferase [Euryarchaeota archaeon]|nr:GNAT family N-acetyltransferase [Euryarchaeota archaeon]MDE1837262.1 GNAT family N-acetyltransferase [Euryarchaeota archaeon]MDE1879932.1 GNAT family N-acetyltransferase [Euryarchaeota archaeon]MDE2045134.1 GNAT family N-acetyltransferase [Thermoplasmata archaeon]
MEEVRFAIIDRRTRAIVGGGRWVRVVGHPERAGIGYWVAAPFRRRGIAGEAVHAACRACFAKGEVSEVLALVPPDNAPSISFLTTLGFSRVAVAPRAAGTLSGEARMLEFLVRPSTLKSPARASPFSEFDPAIPSTMFVREPAKGTQRRQPALIRSD